MIQVADTPRKGLGVFATQPIAAGTKISSERPLVVGAKLFLAPQPGPSILRQLQGLTADENNAIFALKNNYPEMDPIMGIIMTSGIPLGETAYGLCPRGARFNHSSRANAAYSWNEDVNEVRVFSLHSIAEDEEITISYFSAEEWAQARDVRMKIFSHHYGMDCACAECLNSTEEDRERSDARRHTIAFLEDQVHNGVLIFLDPGTALGMCRSRLEYIQMEGSGAWSLERIYNDAFPICVCHGDIVRAKESMGLSIKATKA
jgi:hypothetical protein